jgi:cytochrome b561
MNEDPGAWPLPLRLIHWISAVLVIGMLGLGTSMVQLVQSPAVRFDLTQTHKSIGVTVFALTLVRLCVRSLLTAPNPQPEPVALLVLLGAKVTHICLYGLLLVLPLSGWLMVTTTPVRVPTTVFGLFELPYPLAPDLPAYRLAHAGHVVAATALAVLVVLHVAAGLVHAIWWRDRTVQRMWRKSHLRLPD